jgi:hypothetical protein
MKGMLSCGSLLTAALLASAPAPSAASLLSSSALTNAADAVALDETVASRGGRAGAARGRVGGAAVRRTTVVGPRGGVARGTTGVWVRPGYRWGRGGAIAAGAAIGFVGAATAAAWAGAAPAPGLCWYYTDPSRTQGFWDYCP